ncbi:MAG TPA: NADH-quinone oxidoreductase subunit N [Terracidiphilus sp.]
MNYADLFHVTLPETALELAALLVLLVDLVFLRKAGCGVRTAVAAAVGVAGCVASMFAIGVQTGAGLSLGDTLVLTNGGIAAVAQMGVLALTILTLLLLADASFTKHVGEFVAVILMSAAGGLLIAAAQDLLVIFIGLELLSLGLYILTAFAKRSEKSAESALKYYLFGGMSAAFLLFGFSYLYGLTGSTNLHAIALGAISSFGAGNPLFYVALVLVAAGLGFKVAAAPFHLWAPDTYEGAPTPAAAFIASVSKVASFALLISFSSALAHAVAPTMACCPRPLVGLAHQWGLLLAVLAGVSMVVGNLAALAQTSVRRLLAYSAVAHAGYVVLGLAYFTQDQRSAQAILYYVLTYGLTTVGAFGVISVVERATGSDKMDAFLGLSKKNPLLAGVLLVLFLSLAGIPPLVGFWAKFNLFAAVLSVGAGAVPFGLVALALAMSAVSLYYYLQVLKRAYVMPAADDVPVKAGAVTTLVLVAIAAAVVALGCFPVMLQNWIAGF